MPDHRIFQQLHHQHRETCSFHITRHDAGRRTALRSPSLEESILNVVVGRPQSQVQDLLLITTSFEYGRLSSLTNGTEMCSVVGLHSSCAEQL
ncbi:hypothetical protein TNCV_3998851 [Trichonephila clavipes]|nr:hypothetical protein TNCV_3998851 [Trichonephila clavipes]